MSVDRINDFLNSDELDPKNVSHEPSSGTINLILFIYVKKFSFVSFYRVLIAYALLMSFLSPAPVTIENGTFSWGNVEKDDKGVETKTYPPILKNINMDVKKNGLVAIVGTVGSGKSSVLSALLGEMEKLSGRVNTVGSIAYVSQQAWIQNASLQDNILFGSPMDRNRYNRVIDACALKPDIEMLPGMPKNYR